MSDTMLDVAKAKCHCGKSVTCVVTALGPPVMVVALCRQCFFQMAANLVRPDDGKPGK